MTGILWRGMQKFKNIEVVQGGVHIGVGGVNPPTTDYFVDTTNGDDGNSGLGWGTGNALATIQEAMDKITALATRGRFRVFVAPGEYAENVITPLNSVSPFGQLIAWNPTPGRPYGAAYIIPASGVALTVRARGWLISGFEFDGYTAAACVHLDGTTSNASCNGTQLEDCLFCGQNKALCGIDVTKSGAPLSSIRNCGFYGFHSGSTAGTCIMCSESGTDQPRFWLIEHCWFGDSDNLLMMNPRGFKECVVRYNTFLEVGATYTATKIIDNTGGNATQFYGNKFSGTYGTGNYVAAANDEWGGNYVDYTATTAPYGLTMKDPA